MSEPSVETDALADAVRQLLRTAQRPTKDSATAQVNGGALDRLRAALAAHDDLPSRPGGEA